MTDFAGIRANIGRIRALAQQPLSDPASAAEQVQRECWHAAEQALEALTRAVYDLEQAAEKARRSR